VNVDFQSADWDAGKSTAHCRSVDLWNASELIWVERISRIKCKERAWFLNTEHIYFRNSKGRAKTRKEVSRLQFHPFQSLQNISKNSGLETLQRI
jgi:hypothetical protein